ncbi:MAG: hypothetical protein GY820_09950 [Gammaproteobacteria bacterium]|nr:hypothetical protein [Gammaproteobacteria bacterium]
MSARNCGAPPGRGPGEGTGGTPSEPQLFGAQPNSGSSEQQGRPFAESAETPMIGRQPTAQALGGTLPWGAQTAGENQPFGVGTGLHQHANHSSGESHGGGQCCTKQQLPPLEPFDPEKSAKREYALFETEFKQHMKLEKVPYSEWGGGQVIALLEK